MPGAPAFYEAPHRILETLAEVERVLGPRPVVVVRELTKVHEEFLRGTAGEIRAALASRPAVKREITLLAGRAESKASDSTPVEDAVEACSREGMSRMEAIKEVARRRGFRSGKFTGWRGWGRADRVRIVGACPLAANG